MHQVHVGSAVVQHLSLMSSNGKILTKECGLLFQNGELKEKLKGVSVGEKKAE